jgi:biotin carboxylase
LLLGADEYVIRACERHDVDAVLLCQSRSYDSGRLQLAPRMKLVRVDDLTNAETCLAALHRAGLADQKFDAIQTTFEYGVVTASVLGHVLGCRSVDPVTALRFRDKSLQKATLRAAGVPVARTTVIEDIYDVSGIEWEYDRAVLKPVAGGGTKSTTLVRDRAELEAASREYRAAQLLERSFLLEEYIEGDEWMAEGVVFGGQVRFFGLGVYTEPCLDAVTGQVPISLRRIDPTTEADAYEQAEPVVRDAITALGLQDGVFHMELFRQRETGRIYFSECAARRGGAFTHEQVQAKFNVDLGEAALLCAIGRQPELEVKVTPRVVGCAAFYGPAGTLFDYPTESEMMAQPNVTYARTMVPIGSQLSTEFSATSDMLVAMLLVTDSIEEFHQRVPELRDWFGERLIVAEPGLTTGQRRAWQRKHWPDRQYGDQLYQGQ